MGLKLAAVMAILMFAMGGAFYWYYNDTQERIGILRENNAKLETAVAISEASIETLKGEMERFAEANKQLQQDLQRAEAYGDELQSKLNNMDLVQDALKDAAVLEGKMNGATAKLWRKLEELTGGDPDSDLPEWLQPFPGGEGESGNQNREDTGANSSKAKTTTIK